MDIVFLLKIVVYLDNEGRTKIGLPKPTALVQMVEGEELQKIAADIEEINKSK